MHVPSVFPDPPSRWRGSLAAYAAAVLVTIVAIESQYVVPQLLPGTKVLYGTLLGGLFVVYGVPILAFAILVGGAPLRTFAARLSTATVQGLRWFGLLSLTSLLVTIVLVTLYAILDPSALDLLRRPNPVLQAAASNPWFWVAFSFVIGAVEETIFRGWIFGYWLTHPTSVAWWVHGVWTSALFAGVHLYYATTYGIVAPIQFSALFLLGFAFAATVHASGGNLVVVSVLHGANDAAAFLSIVSTVAGLLLLYGLVGAGAIIALVLYLQRPRPAPPMGGFLPPPPPFPPPPPPPPTGPASPY